jgi:formimidoylglutamate deiminase
LRKRNVSLLHQNGLGSTGQVLFENALEGGTQAAGVPLAGIALGQRADLVEINLESDALLGVPAERLIDALIFSTPSTSFDNVYVAGKKVEHRMTQWRTDFLKTMAEL